jgi:hypothetical protein
VKSETKAGIESALEPWLLDFLDRVIIPALLREFKQSVLAYSERIEAKSPQETPKEEFR